MIVVTAPTGQTGRGVLGHLLDGTESIRVIARDPSRLDARVREGAEVVTGSHNDPAVLAEAFTGADTVFWLVPPDPRASSVEGYYLDFTRPACEAARRQGVRRVVGVSSLGRTYGGTAGNLSAAFAMDTMIEATGVDYRALRMPYFMENHLHQVEAIRSQGTFFLPNTADRPLATVATRDIATTAAALLSDPTWTGQDSIAVVSPDDLSPNGMAVIMSEVLDRPVRAQEVPTAGYAATMARYGMTEAWAQGLADMAAAQNDGIYDAEVRTAKRAATGFREWCEDTLKPAVLA